MIKLMTKSQELLAIKRKEEKGENSEGVLFPNYVAEEDVVPRGTKEWANDE